MDYFNSKTFAKTTVAAIRPKVEEALKTNGFGVLTEIDIQATMKKKLDKDYLPYLILGACHPMFADKVLSIDPHIGLMLPCNVTIRALTNEEVEVAMINPFEAMKANDNPAIVMYAKEVNEKLTDALDKI